MKAKIRWRNGTREESLQYVAELAAESYPNAKQDARDMALPDGHPEAVRVSINRDTGEVIRKNGSLVIGAPWLMAQPFGLREHECQQVLGGPQRECFVCV